MPPNNSNAANPLSSIVSTLPCCAFCLRPLPALVSSRTSYVIRLGRVLRELQKLQIPKRQTPKTRTRSATHYDRTSCQRRGQPLAGVSANHAYTIFVLNRLGYCANKKKPGR